MTKEQKGRSSVLVGAVLMLGMSTMVAIDTVIVRFVVAELNPLEITFFRTLFGLAFMIPWLWRGGFVQFRTRFLRFHLFRAAGKLAAMGAFFYAVSLMPLAEFTAIIFSIPLFAAIGAWLFLGESMRPLRLFATIVGFIGVLIVIRPSGDFVGGGALFALGAAVGLAAIGLVVKHLTSKNEKSETIVFWNLALLTPMALVASLPVWAWPSWEALAWLFAQGFLGFVSQLCFTKALQFGDASTLMPVDFMRLPIVAAIAYVVFAEVPGLGTWIGGAVIFVAVLLLIGDERRRVSAPTLLEP